jgi:hypothetical protein
LEEKLEQLTANIEADEGDEGDEDEEEKTI